MICLEKVDSSLNLLQHFLKLYWVLNRFFVVQNVRASLLILVVQLMFLDFFDNAAQHILPIEDHHARLLEVSRTCHNHCLIDFNLAQIVAILLKKFFLLGQILISLLNEFLQLDLMWD